MRGNNDNGAWSAGLREAAVLNVGELMVSGVNITPRLLTLSVRGAA